MMVKDCTALRNLAGIKLTLVKQLKGWFRKFWKDPFETAGDLFFKLVMIGLVCAGVKEVVRGFMSAFRDW